MLAEGEGGAEPAAGLGDGLLASLLEEAADPFPLTTAGFRELAEPFVTCRPGMIAGRWKKSHKPLSTASLDLYTSRKRMWSRSKQVSTLEDINIRSSLAAHVFLRALQRVST